MKYLLALAAIAMSTLAQKVSVTSPTLGSTVSANDLLVVDVMQGLPLGVLEQRGLVMVLKACDNGVCSGAAVAGIPATVIYNGPFNPQLDILHPEKGVHQSFTVTIPEGVSGPSILGVIHYLTKDLAGTPLIEFTGVSFNVQ